HRRVGEAALVAAGAAVVRGVEERAGGAAQRLQALAGAVLAVGRRLRAGGLVHPVARGAAGLRRVPAAVGLARAAHPRAPPGDARVGGAGGPVDPRAAGARLRRVPAALRVGRGAHAGAAARRDARLVHAGDGRPPVPGPVAGLDAVARALLRAGHARPLA